MEPGTRILAFGSAVAVTIAGVLCGVLIGGSTGQVLALGLVLLGLGGGLLLIFFEVGLSEDRALAKEEEERRRRERRRTEMLRRPRIPRRPRRPG